MSCKLFPRVTAWHDCRPQTFRKNSKQIRAELMTILKSDTEHPLVVIEVLFSKNIFSAQNRLEITSKFITFTNANPIEEGQRGLLASR